MGFNAGSIEATLTLNRNPFSAGLKAARKQADDFKDITVGVKFVATQAALKQAIAGLQKKVNASNLKVVVPVEFKANTAFLRATMKAFQKAVDNSTVKVNVPVSFKANVRDINAAVRGLTTDKTVRVPLTFFVSRRSLNDALREARELIRDKSVRARVQFTTVANNQLGGPGVPGGIAGMQGVYNGAVGFMGRNKLNYRVVYDTSTAYGKLRQELEDLRRLSIIRPTYEIVTVIDQMGRARQIYRKVATNQGTFIGEVMGRNTVKRFAALVRHPYLFGPIIAGAGALVGSAAILGIPAVFASIAAKIQSGNAEVATSFHQLKTSVIAALGQDTAQLADNFINSAQRIGTAFQGLRPQLVGVFDSLGPSIDLATTGLINFAQNAMPGVQTATYAAKTVMEGFAAGAAEAGNGATRFLNAISTAAPAASQSLQSLGFIAADIAEMFGRLLAAVTNVFGNQLWNEAEAIFQSLSAIIGDFAESALPKIGIGLEIASNAFSVLLSIIEPFAGILGTVVGTALAFTIVIRSFSGLIGIVLALGKALTFAPAIAALNTLRTQTAASGVALAGMASKGATTANAVKGVGTAATGAAGGITAVGTASTKASAAGNKIASGFSKVGTVLGKVGSALPIVGVALVGIGLAFDAVSSKAEAGAQKVAAGSATVQEAVAAEADSIMTLDRALKDWGFGYDEVAAKSQAAAEASANVTAALEKELATATPLEAARIKLGLAQIAHNEAIRQFGPDSAQAASAAAAVGAATEALGTAQEQAANKTKGLTQALRDQVSAMQSQVDSSFALEDATAKTAEAMDKASAAIKKSGVGSKEASKALNELERAFAAEAKAAGASAEAQSNWQGEVGASQAYVDAYNLKLQELAASGTAGQTAFVGLASRMDAAGLAMLSAAAEATGLRTEIVLINGTPVKVVVEADQAKLKAMIEETERFKLGPHNATVAVDANKEPAQTAFDAFMQYINGSQTKGPVFNGDFSPLLLNNAAATSQIDGQTVLGPNIQGTFDPALAGLLQYIGDVDKTNTVGPNVVGNDQTAPTLQGIGSKIQGLKVPGPNIPGVDQTAPTLQGIVGKAQGTKAEVPITGNPTQGNAVIDGVKTKADSTVGIVKINAESSLGDQVLATYLAAINGTTGIAHINAEDSQGQQVLKAFLDTVNRSIGTVRINADPRPALDVLRQLLNTINSSVGTVTIQARAVGGVGAVPNETGNFLKPMANGGVVGLAGGGMPSLTPMSNSKATVVPPNTWRVLGDNMKHPELFAPLDGSSRSLSFIQMGAATFGKALVDVSKNQQAQAAKGGSAKFSTTMAKMSASSGSGVSAGMDAETIASLVRTIVAEVQPVYGSLHIESTPKATAADIVGEVTFRARNARRLGVHSR